MTYRTLTLLLLGLLATGCAGKLAGPKHPWYSLPPEQDPRGGWTALPESQFRAIDPRSNWKGYDESMRRLKDAQVVELSDADLAKILPPSATTRPSDNTKPYLVRGIAYGFHPDWRAVWTDATQESIWIHQATPSPESAIAVVAEKQKPLPLVLFLNHKPDRIYVTALDSRTSPLDRRKLLR